MDYWTSRFPRLLVHSWHAMHSVKSEPTFQKYFDKDYDFLQVRGRGKKDEGKMRMFAGTNV